jgi:hypothetical protein
MKIRIVSVPCMVDSILYKPGAVVETDDSIGTRLIHHGCAEAASATATDLPKIETATLDAAVETAESPDRARGRKK